jgi:uncharacterized protein YdeI (YjbR/CyaY-like superfamily)
MGSLTLTVTLQPRGPAAAVVLSDGQVAEIGEGAKRFPFARWVTEAKRDETRQRRVSEALRMLREGKTRS